MKYERPMIVHREPIDALLQVLSVQLSDVNLKENIVPVRW